MSPEQIHEKQKAFFETRATFNIDYRINALKKLQKTIKASERDIFDALKKDLGKSNYESFLTEVYVILNELDKYIKNTKSYAKPNRVRPSILNFPSTAKIYKEPYGNTLVIAPWNYPFQLALGPVIGAIAAGNTVVLKPSEFVPATSKVLVEIVSESCEADHVSVILGDANVSQKLTALKWDYIFFTGSPKVGKIIYKAAAEHMTPVTLELGGKNPCVIHESANIPVAARRIAWGKFLNAGQTCIAPDYILCHKSVKVEFTEALKKSIIEFYGENPQRSDDYPRIIREEHFENLVGLLKDETVIHGGNHDKDNLYLEPTLVDEPSLNSKVMADEIFGPILPILSYETTEDISNIIKRYPKPLGGYCFTEDKSFASWFIDRFSYGGGVINDSIVQFINERLPFGGVGDGGIGAYHGKKSFETFSHHKSMVHRRTWLDIKIKYPPYNGKLSKIRKMLKWV
ncbi:aldehyde dehydrogenase [Nonlabens spongiae]|uniref:Aldehyde dehydrogenase n=1 Tax=Nonlabens spongiae TaxID=331648 RepID=A0A1W6MHP2_9FLAO|nr:aldehyde dehydrogenase [Nonlabens spongiae]ARN77102.1 aldehyde dehydrogenase [Nonlabens spongiae]